MLPQPLNQGQGGMENTSTAAVAEINVTETLPSPGHDSAPADSDVQVQMMSEEPVKLQDDVKGMGKEDCDALYKECVEIQLQNAKFAERIRRTNKVVRRIQKERRFLIKKLEGFGDNYQLAKLKLIEEQESRIADALKQEDEELAMRESKKLTKRKLKVKRLENAPKKPSNAFLMFCQKNRAMVQEDYSKMHSTEISRQEMTRKLAELWKKTPEENRKTYYEMYQKDKARYAQEMKDFESKNLKTLQTEHTAPSTPDGNLVIHEPPTPSAS